MDDSGGGFGVSAAGSLVSGADRASGGISPAYAERVAPAPLGWRFRAPIGRRDQRFRILRALLLWILENVP